MKVRKNFLISFIVFIALGVTQFAVPTAVYASGVVGTGTPGSCDDAALTSALGTGGSVTFNCGASPHTITILSTKVISSNTQIDGGGLITISGDNLYRVFDVSTGVNFDVTGLTVTNGSLTYTDPSAVPLPLGGAAMVFNSGATVNITNSTFAGNHGVNVYGGAIYVKSSTLNITNSTFSNNNTAVEAIGPLALGGGAIQNDFGTITITGSTFSNNSVTATGADGGAIYNGILSNSASGTLTITNSTFFGNQLDGDTIGSSGGAIRSNATLTLIHSTFDNNDGGVSDLDLGDGGSGAVTAGAGTVTFINNIFADSYAVTGTPFDCMRRNAAIVHVSSGGNLMESSFQCGTALFTTDPNLVPALGNHGGSTQTLAFAGASVAVDAVSCAVGVTADQRGVVRPTGSACDIGAVELDSSSPTVTINQAGGQADPTNGSVNFTVVFNESVLGFATGDVSFAGSTVGGTLTGTVSGGPTTFNVAVTGMTTPGDIVASINAGVGTDTALNPNAASTSSDNIVAYDATGPTVTINKDAGQPDPTNSSTVNFAVVFDESVTGFNESDVTIGGTANPTSKVVTGSGTTYNVAVSGLGNDGTVTAAVNAGAVSDALGNPSSASTTATVTYDATGPTVTIDQKVGQTDPTNASPIEFTVVFSEGVSGFINSDVSLSSGTAVVTGGPSTYNVAVSGMSQGVLTASIPAGAVTDALGNGSSASTTSDNSVTYDTAGPTVTINQKVGQADPTNASPIEFTVVFSENVSGFDNSDVSVTSGSAVVTGGSSTYNVAVSGMSQGALTVSIPASVATDAAGNGNSASTTSDNSVTYDTAGPTVTINQKVGQADPTNASPIEFTVVFSEGVSGFDNSDVTVTSGSAVVTGGPSSYNVSVSGMSQGILGASISAAAATDEAGNANTASTSSDNTVTYDITGITVTINQKVGQADPTPASPIEFTVVFSESVSNFVTGDVSLTGTAGATIATVTGSGTTYNVAVSGMAQNGTVIASLSGGVATDLAGNGNSLSTSSDNQVTYDTTGPTVTINQAAGQADPTGFAPANFTVIFASPITGFDSSDVSISGTATGLKTAAITEIAPNDGTTYNVAISGMTSGGTVVVAIPSSVVLDGDGNPNFASTSTDNSVTFNFVKPGVPTLTSPISGVLVSGLRPLLDWNDSVPGAQYYQVQISTLNTFASLVLDQSNVVVSEFSPTSDLVPGVKYYWRVRAYNAIGMVSNWSTTRSFSTPLLTPVLSSPISGVVLDTDRPTFSWSSIPGATSYTLQISTASNFSSIAATRNLTSTTYLINVDLIQNRLLYWRVLAKTSVVTSAWSSVQSFKTGNPPTVPTLSVPANNALIVTLTPLFDWSNSTLPTPPGSTLNLRYQIQIADNIDFASPIARESTPSRYQSVLGDGLQPNVKYYWRVRSVNTFGGIDQFSAWSSVFYYRSAMTKPVLVAPANTTTPALVTRRPTFDWQETDGATGYQIAVSVNANMASPLLSKATVLSAYLPTADLPANATLFWRVRATGLNGPGVWSDTWTFKTGNPPSIPALVSPTSNALTLNYFPLFDWGNSTVPTGSFKYYEIQVDNNSDFLSTAIDNFTSSGILTDSKYQTQLTDVLDPNTTYYWRVRAISTVGGADHVSSWSSVRTFRTPLAPPGSLTVIPNALTPGKPTFDWADVAGAAGYSIQVSISPTFGTVLVNASTSASSYVPIVNLPLNTPLYWRVRAKGTNLGVWSTATVTLTP